MPVVPKIYRSWQERDAAEIQPEREYDEVKRILRAWLDRKIDHKAGDVIAHVIRVSYPAGTVGGAYVALRNMLGWADSEPQVIHILKAAGNTYRDQLPKPRIEAPPATEKKNDAF